MNVYLSEMVSSVQLISFVLEKGAPAPLGLNHVIFVNARNLNGQAQETGRMREEIIGKVLG